MIVARTVETFFPHVSGPAREAYELSSALEAVGIPSPVYVSRLDVGRAPPSAETLGRVRVERLPSVLRAGRYAVTPGLLPRLRRADLVDCHNLRNAQLDLAALSGRPFVIHTHGGLRGHRSCRLGRGGSLAYRLYDRLVLERVLSRASALVVATGAERAEALAAGIPGRKVRVIPPGVRAPAEVRVRGGDPARPRLLTVGRLGPQRHPEVLIDALALLPGATLALAGPVVALSALEGAWTPEALRKRARDRGVADRVTFAGEVPEGRMEEVWASGDVFLYVSEHEGAGFPMLEAAARGLPLVVSRVGIAPDIVREGETGMFAPPSAEAVAGAVRALCERGPWEASARHARERILPRYRWEASAQETAALYRGILG